MRPWLTERTALRACDKHSMEVARCRRRPCEMSGRCSDPGSTGSAGSLQRLGNATSMSGSRRSNMSLGGFPQTTTGRLEIPSDVLPPVRSVSWAQYRISTRLQCQTLSDEGAKHTCTPRQGRASYTPCLVRLTPHSSSHLRINQPSREIRDRAARAFQPSHGRSGCGFTVSTSESRLLDLSAWLCLSMLGASKEGGCMLWSSECSVPSWKTLACECEHCANNLSGQ